MILVVHRNYRLSGGEEVFLDSVLVPALALRRHEFEVLRLPPLFSRGHLFESLIELTLAVLGLEKLRPSYFQIKKALQKHKPGQVILNNFIPTISLAVVALARDAGATTTAWVHNGRLSCANGLFFNRRAACHRCFTHGSRWAFFYRCQPSWSQSLIYALIYRHRRVAQSVVRGLTQFAATSDYTAENIRRVLTILDRTVPVTVVRSAAVKAGQVQPHYPQPRRLVESLKAMNGAFFIFIGRISFEKGADLFAQLAARWPSLNFVLCGDGPELKAIARLGIQNLFILGQVNDDEKNWLYQEAAGLILTSRVPENAPMVIVESQASGIPVIYPRGGGAEELVRVLGRAGCALEDFKGQTFSRSKNVTLESMQLNFEDRLDEILLRKMSASGASPSPRV